ncbi:MAG: type II/IV secretion system protein [Chthonomonadales bacterium]|nr:type II/IV secretion system protein [Chthonomonadales bacterium]
MAQVAAAPAARKFRLVLREGGVSREMGGESTALGVSIVDRIFTEALDGNASDIHIQPERDRTRIRFRVDGVMHQIGYFPNEHVASVLARIKLAAGMHIDERRVPQDGRIDMEYAGRRFSARVSVLPSLNGEKVVIRLLDPASVRIDIARLGMPEAVRKEWLRAIQTPYGMIVVTGPTGSGKTSTLYASINSLDRQRRNIVTVEDPIEYEFHDNITQVQVTDKMGFARVMRSFLRQDPDVMMVGEMRDPESLSIGIQASLTGHLVLTTLHTNNAVETLGRMMDMGGEPYLVASTVLCILAQRLVRVICDECKQPYTPTPDEMLAMGLPMEAAKQRQFYHGAGCKACRETGFRGRIGVFELLVNNPDLKALIAQRAGAMDMHRLVRAQGMRTMMEDGVDKVLAGITTPSEVIHAVYTAAMLEQPVLSAETEPITSGEQSDFADEAVADQSEA